MVSDAIVRKIQKEREEKAWGNKERSNGGSDIQDAFPPSSTGLGRRDEAGRPEASGHHQHGWASAHVWTGLGGNDKMGQGKAGNLEGFPCC